MNEKALKLLGLMRKANAVMIGETDSGAAARAGQAKLLALASDASDNAKSRAEGFVYMKGIPLTVLPFTKDEISSAVGKSGCSMLAICDIGFADAFMKELCEGDPEKYSSVAETVSGMHSRVDARRQEARAHEKNKRTGKRRNNA